MKNTKILFSIFLVYFFTISITGCKKCRKEDPRARVANNGTQKASIQIKTSGGNTENINNVDPGYVSDWRNFEEGTVTFTITVDKNVFVKTVDMIKCYEYDVAIDANNNIISTPTDRNK